MANETHKALRTIHVAPTVDPKDREAFNARRESGIPADQYRVLTPNERFNPGDAHMPPEEVKRLEAAGAIRRLEGAEDRPVDLRVGVDGNIPGADALAAAQRPAKDPDNPNVSENRTPGSGALRQGTQQAAPPGIDEPGSAPAPARASTPPPLNSPPATKR